MPGYKTHLLGGAITFAPLYYFLNKFNGQQSLPWAPLLFGITLLGSLIPDLDVTSKIQRLFYFCTIVAFLCFLLMHQWMHLLIIAILALIVGTLRHRTILHHPVFLTLLPFPIIYYMSNNSLSLSATFLVSLFFIAGAWSHLLLDFGLKKAIKRH